MHQPSSVPQSIDGIASPAQRVPGRVGQRAAVLYGVWALIAGLAHAAGAVALPTGAGLILGLGGALTLGLFMGLARLPLTEQPADDTVVAAQSVMGIVWATLYTWFAGASAGGAVLGVGMYLSAIALALPGTSLPALGRLMVAAAIGSVLTPVLQQAGVAGGVVSTVGLLTALLPSLVLVVLLGAMHLAASTLASAREQLQARNAELQAGIERIARRAERDQLTNSYNRQSILEMVGREKARADRSGESLCVCLLDIDHFKDMNDRFGHQTGDRILAAFARRVRGALRTMDVLNSGGLPTP
ncbi:MAG: GGDEF domain-containing protein, partial [Gammaproteobacteria bacterium]|nr:GGDEF domain-containing protein [Gammaproteobacteria bacterium]